MTTLELLDHVDELRNAARYLDRLADTARDQAAHEGARRHATALWRAVAALATLELARPLIRGAS